MSVVATHRGAPRPVGLPGAQPVVRLLHLDLEPDELAVARTLLTDDERRHADRGVGPVARRRIALRAGLRVLAGDVLGLAASDVPISAGPHGRPELDVAAADLGCSRSGDLGLVAVAVGCRVGVDVEQVAPFHPGILDEPWLTSAERLALRALAPADRAASVTRCWTRKEAVLKGIGTGLLSPPADLEAGVGDEPVLVGGWHVVPVPVPPGRIASLAMRPAPLGARGRSGRRAES